MNALKTYLGNKYVVVACISIFVALTVAPAVVKAVTAYAPDANDFRAGTNTAGTYIYGGHDMYLMANYGSGLGETDSVVSVYMRATSGTVTIQNAGTCSDGTGPNSGGGNTTYRFETYSPVSGTRLVPDRVVGTYCGNITQTVSGVTESVVLEGVRYYRFKIRSLKDNTSGGNAHKIIINGGVSFGFISYYNQSGTEFTIQDRAYVPTTGGRNRMSIYSLKFATDCTITGPTTADLLWFDDDWGPNGGPYALQRNMVGENFRMELREYDRVSGALTSVRYINHNQTTNFSTGWPYTGFTGNQANGRARFTARPDRKYEWVWYDVRKVNGIQFQIPYDSVNYLFNCATNYNHVARLHNSSTPSGTVNKGDIITIFGDALNTGDGASRTNNFVIHAYNDVGLVSATSYSGGPYSAGDTDIRWSQPAIAAGGNSADKYVRFVVDDPTNNGGYVCFVAVVSPTAGQSTPTNNITNGAWNYSAARRCFTVNASPPWNNDTRLIGTTPAAGTTFVHNQTFRATGDVYNTGAASSASHTQDIYIHSQVGLNIVRTSYSSGGIPFATAGSTLVRWSRPAVGAGATSNDLTVNYRVNDPDGSGGSFCIRARADRFTGYQPGNNVTSSGWNNEDRCYSVAGRYDYNASTEIRQGSGGVTRVKRGSTYFARTRVANSLSGAQTYAIRSYATDSSGGTSISMTVPSGFSGAYNYLNNQLARTGGSNPGSGLSAGNTVSPYGDLFWYLWNNQAGLSSSARNHNAYYRVKSGADLGSTTNDRQVCHQARVAPNAGTVGTATGDFLTNTDCATIFDQFDYTIGGGVVSVGSAAASVSFTVTNTDTGPGAADSRYQLSSPNGLIVGTVTGNLGSLSPGVINTASESVPLSPGIQPGDYTLRIRVLPCAGDVYSNAGDVYTSTTASCTQNITVTVAEHPYFEVVSGDVWAGGKFADATDPVSTCTGAIPTSGIQVNNARVAGGEGGFNNYAVFSTDSIVSQDGIFFGSISVIGNSLSFANTVSPLGNFSAGKCMTNFYELLAGSGGVTDFGSSTSLASKPAGTKVIYAVDGNVNITGDISYGTYSANSLEDIPFFMVVASGNINISGGVDRLDGIYIAGGNIDTCTSATRTNNACDNLLTVNGAFIAQSIDFDRTEGGLLRGGEAEIFNYGPEVLLGAPDIVNDLLGGFEVSQYKDLPPIY